MSDYTESLLTLGQVNTQTAQLISATGRIFDITPLILEITLYEDVFSNTMSGYLLIEDSLDLINNVPLIGQEQFKLELQTPTLDNKIEKTFYIYKLQHRMVKGRSQVYMLNFCSRELIYSSNSKISKAFDGKISETVSEIFTDTRYLASEEKLYIEPTENEYKFIAPFWTPLETINWLTGKSINSDGVANYLFFETNQSFEFVSIDSLLKNPPVREYTFADVDANTVFGVEGTLDNKYSIVESMDNGVTFDYLRNLNAGMYASKLYTYDYTAKMINSNTFDYIDDFEKSSHLESVPLRTPDLARKKLASLYFIEKNNYLTGDFVPQGYSDFFLQRNSLLEQLSALKVAIKVHGRTDIKVGAIIKFTVLEIRKLLAEELDAEEGKSDYFTGKYLVTAIRHQIINGKHIMYMEIVSDSFIKELIKNK